MASTTYLKSRYNEMLRDLRKSQDETMKWFQDAIKQVSGNDIMQRNKQRLQPMRRMSPKLIGRMVMYYYDPKWKDTLPYYDRFPLVFPVSFDRGSFIGINVHYLPHQMRMTFYQQLVDLYADKHLDESRRLNISYQILQRSMAVPYYKPAVKKYLYGHLRSKIYVVDPNEWELTLMLPTERFSKRSAEYVWKESRKTIYGY